MFTHWLTTQPDNQVVRFCWDVLVANGPNDPVYALHHKHRLSGEISLDNIEFAIAFFHEAEAMYRWPDERWQLTRWDRDSIPYFESLRHPSYLVRAAAAHALGQLFLGCLRHSSPATPPAAQLLSAIAAEESRRPGVAGPFLHGAKWEFGGLENFVTHDELRPWMLDTLHHSSREPELPHYIALEFFAHELFCDNADAIEAMLAMNRPGLAVYTATQSPEHILQILPALDRMAASADAEVSEAIQKYLTTRRHHAGTELLSKTRLR